MGTLKLNNILLLATLLFFNSCKEIHKKEKGYCNKYISGGMGFSLLLNEISETNFKELSITSKKIGKLKFLKKYIDEKNFVLGDSILLSDTIFLKFKDKTYKLHSFKNGNMEIFTDGRNGEKYQNCFLESMSFNGEIIKRESNLTFKIPLPNKPDKIQE
ncbi:hypothetical protein CXF68_17390 [Tenacibaculum sp. Bg11-29]|uniref:hypothetical protein n=1 Tax=Tenacibaculum sp. Bg11-29 TaxID=2058306 RepID=UPI000C33EF95|nr:hypothetical protein [Tenacibaculum sp. Bg11-29]PKH52361.1 hypothetical protein CXF68_17390 [Tenacibaculum sp. Bg11-29]